MRIMLAGRLTLGACILLPLFGSVGDVITVAVTDTSHKLAMARRYAIHSCLHCCTALLSHCISLRLTLQVR
jgi:hypothetical protein